MKSLRLLKEVFYNDTTSISNKYPFSKEFEISFQDKYALGKREYPDHSRAGRHKVCIDSDSQESKMPCDPSLKRGLYEPGNEWNPGPRPCHRGPMCSQTIVQLLLIPLMQ